MDQTEQEYIDRLFDKLRQAESQSGPRDPAAERYIQQLISRQPQLTYYMAQAIIVQEEALKGAQAQLQDAQSHIEDLERELASRPAQSSGGGFLGGLFGGGGSQPAPSRPSVPQTGSVPQAGGGFSYPRPGQMEQQQSMFAQYGQQQPYGQPQRGGGFLAGAMQTAAGVAGGVLIGSMLGNMLGGDDAKAAEGAKAEEAKPEQQANAEPAAEPQNDPFANVQNTQYDEDDSVLGGFFGGGGDFGSDI